VRSKASRDARLAVLVALLWATPAPACTLDDVDGALSRDTLNHYYPDALDVLARAVEARRAASLPPSPGLTPSPLHIRSLMAVASRLHGQVRAAAGQKPMAPLAVLMVEAMLWSSFPAMPGSGAPDLHASGPADGDVVIVISEDAARQIAAGRLAFAEAEKRGMLRLYGPDPARMHATSALGAVGMAAARSTPG